MTILRPNQLPAATTPLGATDKIVVDQGAGGVNGADPQDVVDAVAPVVSQADAEAGVDNVDRMTALRTKQSIASEVGVTIASAAQGALASTAVQPSRQVIAGAGLTGGGDLSADRTFNVGAGTGITVNADDVALSATTISRLIPAAGTTSQVLQKVSNTDYDVAWATVAAATAVSYAPQSLTSGEQLQARTNIGAAPLASPPFTGTPTAPTAAVGTATTQLATTAFAKTQGGLNSYAAVATTSGTTIELATSIPANVKRVTISLRRVSVSGSSLASVQLGTASSYETSGYLSSVGVLRDANTSFAQKSSAGFIFTPATTSTVENTLSVILLRVDGNEWQASISGAPTLSAATLSQAICGGGECTLSGELTRIRIVTENGTDTFDSGKAVVYYEF